MAREKHDLFNWRFRTFTASGIGVLSILGLNSVVLSQEAQVVVQPESVWEGVSTEEQIARGKEAFDLNCAGCHGSDLRAVDSNAPDLTGAYFQYNWIGKNLGQQFIKIRNTMPSPAPRSLSEPTYLDILAYILAFNEVPVGTSELPADEELLGRIQINRRP